MASRKKYLAVLWTILAVSIVAAVGIVLFAVSSPDDSVQISQEEFLLIYENEVRSRVLALSQDPAGDWQNEPYGDSTLGQYAVEQTAAALKGYMAQQQIFREYEVYDFSYDRFLDQWKGQENDGNPYGVQAYSQYDYYVYLHSIYRLQVIQKLTVEDAAVKKYYENNSEQFLNADTWVLDVWRVSSETPDAQIVLENAMNGVLNEEVSYTQITIDEDGAKYYAQLLTVLSDAMEQLKTPGCSVFREDSEVCLMVRSKSYIAGQPKSYEECKDVVRNRCKQELFEQAVAQALENIIVSEQELPAMGK